MKNVTLFFKGTMFLGVILLSSLLGCQKEELTKLDLTLDGIDECAPVKKDKFYIGQEYGGGIIYYIDATGKHGLIAAKEDLGPAPWGCMGTLVPYTLDDEQMTKNILAACNEPGIAARLCDEYVVYEKRSGKDKDLDEEKDYYKRKDSYKHDVYEKGKNRNYWKKYDDWFMPGDIVSYFTSAHLTCGRAYWTTFQTSSGPQGPLNPADWVIHFGAGCDANGDLSSIYRGIAKKSSLAFYVRPVRKF